LAGEDGQVGLVPDEEHSSVGVASLQLLERLARAEAAGQGRMAAQALALLLAPPLRGQLGGLVGARLGGEQPRVERRAEARQGDTSRARLLLSARGQLTLLVRSGAVGLSVGVT